MFFEEIIRGIYTAILRPGDIAIDCGASWGIHTVPMSAAVGPTGRVIAIEAIPEMAERLLQHARGNGHLNVELIGTAIGACEGRAPFFHVTGDSAYSGLQQRDLPAGLETGVVSIDVPMAKLDDILSDRHRPVRFIKMDLEGGEYDAIRGGFSSIRKDRPFIVFENGRESTARLYGYQRGDWFRLFDALDYRVFDLLGQSFCPQDWDAGDMPWYFMAVGRGSDERFVRRHLAKLIRRTAASRPTF
jgi:FkbM family methyltransferase